MVYNSTYLQRLARWRIDAPNDGLMGPRGVDLPGAKALIEASGARAGVVGGRPGAYARMCFD